MAVFNDVAKPLGIFDKLDDDMEGFFCKGAAIIMTGNIAVVSVVEPAFDFFEGQQSVMASIAEDIFKSHLGDFFGGVKIGLQAFAQEFSPIVQG